MDLLRTREYEAEIRAYLFGRVGRGLTAGAIDPRLAPEKTPRRITAWWMFEGKRYVHLEGSLARHWNFIHREANRLLGTFSSDWRIARAPEGEVDWIASATLSVTAPHPTYRVRSTSTGLSDDERTCIHRWMAWIAVEWRAYVQNVHAPQGVSKTLPWPAEPKSVEDEASLRRLARTARRSRWSLLRDVIAETIRCVTEREELDRLPLPPGHAAIFQLVCMTRMLRAICPEPEHIRWVDREADDNAVHIPGCRYRHEHHLKPDAVLASEQFDGGLRKAIARHAVGYPDRIDGWLTFDEPRRGFGGIVVEAKSGKQSFKDAVAQLRVYRATVKRLDPRRLVVWGIVEQGPSPALADRAFDELKRDAQECDPNDDLWVFSDVDDVERIAAHLVGAP